MKFCKNIFVLSFIYILFIMLATGCIKDANTESVDTLGSTDTTEFQTFTIKELQDDFDQFTGLIEKLHPKLYANEEELAALIDEKQSQIRDGMTELEFFKLISPIATKLDCGHTNVSLSPDTERTLFHKAVMFPLYLHWIGEHAYVDQNAWAENIPIGAEILSINGKSMREIRSILLDNFSADGENLTRKYFFLNHFFNYFYALIIENQTVFDVRYIEEPELDDSAASSSGTSTASIAGVSSSEYNAKFVSDWADTETPFKSEFETEYAILTFYSFYPEGKFALSDYKSFIDDFFVKIKEKDIDKLILDVRSNGGGDPNVTSHLFSYLAKFEQPYFVDHGVGYYRSLYNIIPLAENRFSGKIAILMNGMSFSSTGHLLALLKYQNVGNFFGEESGGSFACTDSSQNFILANTGIRFKSATSVWEVKVQGLTAGRGVFPDFEIEQTLQQYLSNEDVVKNSAIKWLEEE
ncbi:S41 family peptidase [Fusibacter bizertensis]